jgi:phage terminase large subunit
MLKNLKINPCRVMGISSIDDGINAVRSILPRCRFDAKKCERGLDAMRQYQKSWDETKRCFSLKPMHDWTSHGADAFRTGAQSLKRNPSERSTSRPQYAAT